MDQEKRANRIGLTGGGQGIHMLYLSGVAHHKIVSNEIIAQVVYL